MKELYNSKIILNLGGRASSNIDIFSRMSTIEQNVWLKIHEHVRNNYGDNELWNSVIAPYLNKFVSAGVSAREMIECMDELINHLYSNYLDSQRYGTIPYELRLFFESSGETTLLLGYRLAESVRSLEKVTQLREILQDYNSKPSQLYGKRDLSEFLKTINLIINDDGYTHHFHL